MHDSRHAQIENYLSQLRALIRRGREVRELLVASPGDPFAVTAHRVWQQECGATINQLSGGSKAHWLARSFSEAFLVRSATGAAAQGAAPEQIIDRLLSVCEQAVSSLARKDDVSITTESSEAAEPRRFGFVHNPELRPVVEQAYRQSGAALEQGNFDNALRTCCGILEAIVTDALEHKGLEALAAGGAPEGRLAGWSFEARLAAAENAGLIRGGWARLPAVARAYRDPGEKAVSEREARQTGQVLHVVMRDLDPGR